MRQDIQGSFVARLLIKIWFPYVVAFLVLGLLTVVGYSLWFEARERFPKLAAGSYLGSLDGLFSEEGGAAVRFYIEAFPEREDILFLLLRSGAQPVLSAMASPGGSASGQEWYFPLTITTAGLTFRLSGSLTDGGYYGGTVADLTRQIRGSWWLRPVREGSEEIKHRESEIALWLAARTELEELESGIAFAEKRSPELKSEIEKLTDYVTEGKSLKDKADQKLAAVRGGLQGALDKLQARRQEAQQLEARIDLSQRVTGMGKLVSLARETLDREGRWFDSMLSSSPSSALGELDATVEKAAAIMELKRALAMEEDRIARLYSVARGWRP